MSDVAKPRPPGSHHRNGGQGVLYEHAPASLPAQKLAGEFRTLLGQVREHAATVYDVRRRSPFAPSSAGPELTRPAEDTAYLTLMERLLQVNKAAEEAEPRGGERGARRAPAARVDHHPLKLLQFGVCPST